MGYSVLFTLSSADEKGIAYVHVKSKNNIFSEI